MILVYKDGAGAWHLVYGIKKGKGLMGGIANTSYCGETIDTEEINQIPASRMPGVCEKCRNAYKKALG